MKEMCATLGSKAKQVVLDEDVVSTFYDPSKVVSSWEIFMQIEKAYFVFSVHGASVNIWVYDYPNHWESYGKLNCIQSPSSLPSLRLYCRTKLSVAPLSDHHQLLDQRDYWYNHYQYHYHWGFYSETTIICAAIVGSPTTPPPTLTASAVTIIITIIDAFIVWPLS